MTYTCAIDPRLAAGRPGRCALGLITHLFRDPCKPFAKAHSRTFSTPSFLLSHVLLASLRIHPGFLPFLPCVFGLLFYLIHSPYTIILTGPVTSLPVHDYVQRDRLYEGYSHREKLLYRNFPRLKCDFQALL